MNRRRWSALLDGFSYAALTILVWGVNACQRGLWQDDVQALGQAFRNLARHRFLRAIVEAGASPLRRFTLIPSVIALLTPHPIWALHLLCAVIWLVQGLLAGWIVSLLLPGRRWTRFAVVCLTITATSDLTTGSMVALAYNFAALLFLAAAGCALLWMNKGLLLALVASVALLCCSLLTMDVALPALPFLAFLIVWRENWRPTRRLVAMLAVWGIVLLPIAIVEWSFLHDPASYAAVALVPMSKRLLFTRTITLWLVNFAPWRWAFARPAWFAGPSGVAPTLWMIASAGIASLLFLIRARSKNDEGAPEDGTRASGLAALFAAMALAANAAYARVWFSELHYRTHILSRVWASMAIAIFAGWAAGRWPRWRWLSWAVVVAFVFLGASGGVERQEFYLATWHQHQHELASILEAAPSLRPGTAMVLRGTPPHGRYLATEADYLTKHWLRLLYHDPKQESMRLDVQRGSVCASSTGGIECRIEGERNCFDNQGCVPTRFRYDELIVMDYDAPSGTWQLVRSLRGDALARGHENDAAHYRPESRIVARPWTTWQHRLLLTGWK